MPLKSNEPCNFWDKVAVDADNNCWEWYGGTDISGYGRFKIKGREYKAHRWAYMMENGPIRPDLIVRHICDNPPCVNPSHLELGTHKDNSQDRSKRTHHFKGDTNPNAILTNAQRADIRQRYANTDITQRQLSKEYGVSKAAIWHVLQEKPAN